jgi:hypothetical protein
MVKYSDQVKLCKTGPSDIFGACRHTEKSVLSFTHAINPPAYSNLVLSDGVDGSTQSASQCAIMVVSETHIEKEPSTMDITTLGIDLAKSVFQLHGVNAQGVIVLQKKLRRGAVVKFLSKLGAVRQTRTSLKCCRLTHSLGCQKLAPLGIRGGSKLLHSGSADLVSLRVEVIVKASMG